VKTWTNIRKKMLKIIGGHRHQPSCRRYPTSDIDISYSDIGTKYVELNPFIPISKEFQYRHQLPFRYQTKSISDFPMSKIDKSFPNDLSKILWNTIYVTDFEPTAFMSSIYCLNCSVSRWRPQKVDKRMVLEYTHGLFIT
jgi:hypothetical protein